MTTLVREANTAPRGVPSIPVAIVFPLYIAVIFGLGLYLFPFLASEMKIGLGFVTRTIEAVTVAAQIPFLIAAFACPFVARRFGDGRMIVAAVAVSGILLLILWKIISILMMALLIVSLGSSAAFILIPTVGVISRTVALNFRLRENGLVSSGTAYGQNAAGTIAPWSISIC